MEKFDARKIDKEQVNEIKTIINEHRQKLNTEDNIHLNAVLREDILPLLDRYCTVVYYPKEDKKNNGFHTSYPFHGETIHFVYINTAQYKEKQIFTAAHELGHIWEVDKIIQEKWKISLNADYSERLMNRFAAELLMPDYIFEAFAKQAIEAVKRNGKLTVGGMVQAITAMMNEYFVPYKAVVYRLYELDFIEADEARVLWGEVPSLSREVLEDHSKKVAQEQGFSRLYKDDGRKGIDGLKDLLDKAKAESKLPVQWLKAFYSKFDFEYSDEEKALDEVLRIPEGGEINAGEGCD